MTRRASLFLTIGFMVYLFFFLLMGFFLPKVEFSEDENRRLQLHPSFSFQSFLSGEFGKKYETYLADQFPWRNNWISIKSTTERLLGKKEQNGVYIGKDNYFLQHVTKPDLQLAKKNAAYLNELSKNYRVSVMIVPTATKILKSKLPLFANPYNEGHFISFLEKHVDPSITFIPLVDTLSRHQDEYIYYKTDHHWTTLGAYYGYEAFCKETGLVPQSFTQEIVSTDFLGTLYSKGNFSFAQPDSITLFKPVSEKPLTVTYVNNKVVTNTLYEQEYLTKKDKYGIFLDGNHPYIKIQTNVQNGKKIAVVKDSYANSFIPFLTEHYEEIIVLDYRFLNIPLSTFMTDNNLEDVLILYNTQNFASERKFSLLR